MTYNTTAKQQEDYVNDLTSMYAKVVRLHGISSPQASALAEVVRNEQTRLADLTDENE